MKAIYNKNNSLVGWYDQKQDYVFSKDLIWIGFIENGNFFSGNLEWIGGLKKGTFLDKQGHPIGWIDGSLPLESENLKQPLTPKRKKPPLKPLAPLQPLQSLPPLPPLGGWSKLDWNEYIKSIDSK